MKIKTNLMYVVAYRPTPRCRKDRYKEEYDTVDIELKEVNSNVLKPAFSVKDFIIYSYNDKLWTKANESNIHCPDRSNPMTALEALIYAGVTYSSYYASVYDQELGRPCTKEDMIAKAERNMEKYLLVDGELYIESAEPVYCIYTFGLGHNHAGIGTSLSVDFHYNPNISKERYFNVLEFENAKKRAIEIAMNRGDTDSLYYITKMNPVEVFDKSLVTRQPNIDHGNGNPLLNSMEKMIEGSSSTTEAALLTIATACI